MTWKFLRGDLTRNRSVTAVLTILLTLSAMLMATGAMVMERLFGSVDQLFEIAEPPHFLQMHKGDYDPAALDAFAAGRGDIQAWLVEEMVGFDGSALGWQSSSSGASGDFSDSLIDNLFVSQNEGFDFLVGPDGRIVEPEPGQVYLPVSVQQRYGLQPGDRLTVNGGMQLTVEGFVRDAQMASSLSSSVRLLVADADLKALAAQGGSPEIIIEYRLHDPATAAGFQQAYESDPATPKNGQAVTFQMIRMINAVSDGLVGLALIFVSWMLVAIALLNVRFVIRGTLQDEVHEIGALKAIGLSSRSIAGLFLAKFGAITALACILGGLLAVPATGWLTRGVEASYAAAKTGPATIAVPVIALAVVYLVVIALCWSILRRVRRVEVVNALVHGSLASERQMLEQARISARRSRRSRLDAANAGNLNRRLALIDLRSESRRWALIPGVFALAAVLVTLPANLLSTLENPRFVTYMGAPNSALRVDIQFSQNMDAQYEQIVAAMTSDDRLSDLREFSRVLVQVWGADGWETLPVDVGDYPPPGDIAFLSGGVPGPGQIALSVVNATRYGVAVGDRLEVQRDGEVTNLAVSGIYQDITSGGRTAKMQGQVLEGAAAYVIYADLSSDQATAEQIAAELSEDFPDASVIPMRAYVRQTLAPVTTAFRSAAVISSVFGLAVAALIAVLFLRLYLAQEPRRMAVLRMLGFSADDIIVQVRGNALLAIATGTLAGVLLSATAGQQLVSSLGSMLGVGLADLTLMPNPWFAYLLFPALLVGTGWLAAAAVIAGVRRTDHSAWLR